MITDLWELRSDDSEPSDRATLRAWGFSSGSFDPASMSADAVQLSLSLQDAISPDDLWPWETAVTIYRDDAVFFRGYLARAPRSFSAQDEGVDYEFRNIWWLLERTDYLQEWSTAAGNIPSPRVRLGEDAEGETRVTTKAILTALETFAVGEGLEVSFDVTALPDIYIPPLEAQNTSLAELIRSVMRWHPDATVVPVYSASGTLLEFIPRSSATAVEIAAGGVPLSAFHLVARPDQVPDSVHVYYEAQVVQQTVTESGEEETEADAIAGSQDLLLGTDVYPAESPRTRNSLAIILPVDYQDPEVVPLSITGTNQPITTGPLPRSGATDLACENWWLEHSGLGALGIGTGDIFIPAASTADYRAHKIEVVASALDRPPSAINPAATPVYHTLDLDDLPRELLEGYIHDWMGVFGTLVDATATIAIRKSAVDGLAPEDRAVIEGLNPKETTISDIPALLLYAQDQVVGTDALTKVYDDPGTYNPGNLNGGTVEDLNAAARAEALAAAKIDGLAEHLFAAHSVLHYEGSIALTEEEAGGVRFLGKVLNIAHTDRPEWGSMRAQIQQESINLETGKTTLRFGPPEHLAGQDWYELHRPAREAQLARAKGAQGPQKPTSTDFPSLV